MDSICGHYPVNPVEIDLSMQWKEESQCTNQRFPWKKIDARSVGVDEATKTAQLRRGAAVGGQGSPEQ